MAILIDQAGVDLDSSAYTLDGDEAGVVTPDPNPDLLAVYRSSLLAIDRPSALALYRRSLIHLERQ